MQRFILPAVAVLGIALTAAVSWGGFQGRKSVNALTVGGLPLKAVEGKLGIGGGTGGRWTVSAPTIQDFTGAFLAADARDETPSLRLARVKGPDAEWGIEFVTTWTPSRAGRSAGIDNARLLVGKEGGQFKLKMPQGPFAGWYVGLGPAPEQDAKRDAWRPFILVKDPRAAAVFDYLETEYEVDHK